MTEVSEIKKRWNETMKKEYEKGIQSIVVKLNDEKLIKYIVKAAESKYNNNNKSNSFIRDLKIELAKTELLKRLEKSSK